ncbi:MAG: helicase/exodeoxyribonuclease alpha subunit [Verrucomicrobiales bacterium]|nr:helicase/exodeoxyribonuclease alpha subunit [Verrucomicrobiales bacterium]
MSISSKAVDSFLQRLSPIDRHFGNLLERLSGGSNPALRLAAGLVSYATTEQGHVCITLANVSEYLGEHEVVLEFPETESWISQLRATSVVGSPSEFRPLILDAQGRLYLHRYWKYENALAEQIKSRVHAASFARETLRDGLQRLFPRQQSEINWQQVAGAVAVTRNFTVISGGPGTGKTTTVLKILALLAEQSFPRKLRIALAAPTGMAAARLAESIQNGKPTLNCREEIKAMIPEKATTIHRLLGRKGNSLQFHQNEKNLLSVDVVVIDEASMVDLSLMSHLLRAVPETAKVILLGDKDQLTSIDAGAVLSDLCNGAFNYFSEPFRALYHELTDQTLPDAGQPSAIKDGVVLLRGNFRFSAEIQALSAAIRDHNAGSAISMLKANPEGVSFQSLPELKHLESSLSQPVLENWQSYFEAKDPLARLKAFNQFRVLCALRHGPFGVVKLNQLVEKILERNQLIPGGERWYEGRPIIITRNDYSLNLFNGDVGVTCMDPQTNELCIYFVSEENAVRRLLPLQLPEHETAFATTVHKSQGSEFEKVLLLLPDRDCPVLTAELIYTGLTRARRGVTLWSSEEILNVAITRQVERHSALQGNW